MIEIIIRNLQTGKILKLSGDFDFYQLDDVISVIKTYGIYMGYSEKCEYDGAYFMYDSKVNNTVYFEIAVKDAKE